jgi:ABC-type glycerol-3-phosphate transport system substrate-binding protein
LPSPKPNKPWTWEHVTRAAKKIKAQHSAHYPFIFDQFSTYYQLQPLGVSAGGGNGEHKGTITYTNGGWQRALSWYHPLFEKKLAPRGVTDDKTGALWTAGKVGLTVSGPWGLQNALKSKGKLKFGIAPAPYFKGGKHATATDSWSVGISKKTSHAHAAKQFLRYMTMNPDGNRLSATVAGITPTQQKAYKSYAKHMDASAGESSRNFSTIMHYQLTHNAVHRPQMLGYTVFEPESDKMFADIRNGADPMAAAKKHGKTIASKLKRLH